MTRRSKGEGSIRKRKNGTWEGRYTVASYSERKKQNQKSVYGKTQRECREKLQKAIYENQMINYSREREFTIEEWIETWYRIFSKPNLRVSTANQYRYFIDRFIVPNIGNVKLKDLSNIQVQQFINKMRDTDRNGGREGKIAPKTIKEVFNLLNRALNQAVTGRIIISNPCVGCILPKVEKSEMQILPIEKMKQYLEIANNKGYYALFYLELTTGLRRGELLALEWADLDVEKRELSITKTVHRINGDIVVGPPKTKASNRKIKIGETALQCLLEEHGNHPLNKYMFPSPKTGELRDPDSIARIHKKIAVEIDEPKLRFHDLRHTFTTYSIMSGVDVKTISQTLGHSSSVITLDVYSHVTSEMKRDAADKIEKLMKNVS